MKGNIPPKLKDRFERLSLKEQENLVHRCIDKLLGIVEWDKPESFHFIKSMREVIYKNHGEENLKYLDERIADSIDKTENKGTWGTKKDKPVPYYPPK